MRVGRLEILETFDQREIRRHLSSKFKTLHFKILLAIGRSLLKIIYIGPQDPVPPI